MGARKSVDWWTLTDLRRVTKALIGFKVGRYDCHVIQGGLKLKMEALSAFVIF